MGNGESELPSPGERVQAGSDYRSQLSSLPSLHGSRPWTSTPPAHRILVYSLGIRQTAFTHFPITRIRKTTPERTPSPSMRTRVSGEPFVRHGWSEGMEYGIRFATAAKIVGSGCML